MSGLDTTLQYHFSPTIEAARILAYFSNPTASPITIQIDIPVNFGSDSSTTIVETSSGDTSFTTADNWAMTWDTSSEINTSTFYLPGSPVTPDAYTQTVFNCAGTEGLGATFTLTIPASSARGLVFFAGVAEIDGTGSNDTANALVNAAQFDSLATIDSSLTSDLTAPQLLEISNSSGALAPPPPPPASAEAIPTTPGWILMALSALLIFVAFGRRKHLT